MYYNQIECKYHRAKDTFISSSMVNTKENTNKILTRYFTTQHDNDINKE